MAEWHAQYPACPTTDPHWACSHWVLVNVWLGIKAKVLLECLGRVSRGGWSWCWRIPRGRGLPGLSAATGLHYILLKYRDYISSALYYIFMTCLFYNWNFVSLNFTQYFTLCPLFSLLTITYILCICKSVYVLLCWAIFLFRFHI